MKLRVALAGAGMAARHHALAWSRCADARLVAVADPVPGRASALASEHGIGAGFDDVARMLDEARPDALDIAAAHEAHGALCRMAADAGIPFLCQKPLAPTLAEAERIASEVGARVRWAIHENWCFRPWYREIARRLASGAIGELRALTILARGSGLLPGPDGARPSLVRQPMLATIERLALGEVLVHHVDVARRLAGPSILESVVLRRDVDEVRGETAARLELTSMLGAAIVLDADMACAGAPARIDDRVELLGSRDKVHFDGRRLVGGGAEVMYDPEAGYQASYDAAIADFAAALVHGTTFATPPSTHVDVLRRVEDAYRRAVRDTRRD